MSRWFSQWLTRTMQRLGWEVSAVPQDQTPNQNQNSAAGDKEYQPLIHQVTCRRCGAWISAIHSPEVQWCVCGAVGMQGAQRLGDMALLRDQTVRLYPGTDPLRWKVYAGQGVV